MADPRFKANINVVVGGKSVKVGETFTAPAEQVADALAHRLVAPAPSEAKKKS